MAKRTPPSLRRKVADYEARAAQWKRESQAYIAQHGQAAADAKLDREIEELYGPETDWRCRVGKKPEGQ